MLLEKTLESPLDRKDIKPVNPKGNQPWILIGCSDAKEETPILWPPDAKNWLIGKNPDAGKDWRQEEKRMTEEEMVMDGITKSMDISLIKLLELVKDKEAWHDAVHEVAKSQPWLSNWTKLTERVSDNAVGLEITFLWWVLCDALEGSQKEWAPVDRSSN